MQGGRVISAPRAQRGAQMNLGAARATAEILLFLHADTILPPDALRAICCALRDPQVVGGAFARRYASPSPLLAATCWLADFRSRVLGWHLGDQAIFVRRKIFEHCGRFAEVARFEDLDFSRKLRARGRVVTLWPPVVSSARRFAKDGALLRTAKDLALVLRYHLLGLPSAKTLPSTTTPARRASRDESRRRVPLPMKKWLRANWRWLAMLLVLISLSLAAKTFLPLEQWMKALSTWVEKLGPWGIAAFALIYAVATVLFVPGSVMTIAAGLIFGVGWGALASWSGAVLGASLAFLVGRHLARATIEERTRGNEKFKAIDEAIGAQGWKIVGLLRLSPLIPFNLSNYFYGVTKVRFLPYVLATAVGMLPGTLLYVYLGAAGQAGLGGGAKEHSPLEYTFFGVGLAVTIAVTFWVSRLARAALKKSGAK